jgi:hypothetical protein
MNKRNLMIIVLMGLILILIYALNSAYNNNAKLLVMVEESQEVAEKYKVVMEELNQLV